LADRVKTRISAHLRQMVTSCAPGCRRPATLVPSDNCVPQVGQLVPPTLNLPGLAATWIPDHPVSCGVVLTLCHRLSAAHGHPPASLSCTGASRKSGQAFCANWNGNWPHKLALHAARESIANSAEELPTRETISLLRDSADRRAIEDFKTGLPASPTGSTKA
jgi:hypothetical protein